MKLLKWSEKMAVAAANMLNRGGEAEKIALRKCIDEWSEYLEPELAEKEKKLDATCLGIVCHPELRDISETAKKDIMTMLRRLVAGLS